MSEDNNVNKDMELVEQNGSQGENVVGSENNQVKEEIVENNQDNKNEEEKEEPKNNADQNKNEDEDPKDETDPKSETKENDVVIEIPEDSNNKNDTENDKNENKEEKEPKDAVEPKGEGKENVVIDIPVESKKTEEDLLEEESKEKNDSKEPKKLKNKSNSLRTTRFTEEEDEKSKKKLTIEIPSKNERISRSTVSRKKLSNSQRGVSITVPEIILHHKRQESRMAPTISISRKGVTVSRSHHKYDAKLSQNDSVLNEKELEIPDHLLDIEKKFIKWSAYQWGFVLLCMIIHVIIPDETKFFKPPSNPTFWSGLLLSPFLIWLTYFLWAIPQDRWGWSVNYTRKGTHFTAQIAIFVSLATGLSEEGGVTTDTLNDVISQLIWIGPYQFFMNFPFIGLMRKHVRLFRFMFKSIDRPEDRPFTIMWNSTQTSAVLTVQLLMTLFWETRDQGLISLIPVLVVGLGDGLAEPVGVRWGKHKYKTYGLFTDKTYTRSYEGSACVWFFSVVAIVISLSAWEKTEHFVVAIIVIPVLTTFTEAWAPHTWDNAMIYGIVWLAALGITEI